MGLKKKIILIGILLLIGISVSALLFKQNISFEENSLKNLEGIQQASGETNNNSVGYEFLNDEVLHFWNEIDDYYLNMSSGIQFSNTYEEYWTHNIFCAGYKTTEWNYLCNDELPIQLNVYSDNLTYVQINGTRGGIDVLGRTLGTGIDYYLGSQDDELTITTGIKLISGSPISTDIGFAWRTNNIKIDNTYENDRIFVNNTWYNLEEDLDLLFTNMTISNWIDNWTWNGECTPSCENGSTKENYESCIDCFDDNGYYEYTKIPSYKIQDDSYVSLRWNPNLTYFLEIKNQSEQYNSPVTVAIKTVGLDLGQTKTTSFYWKDPAPSVELIAPGDGDTGLSSTINFTANTTASSNEYIRNMSLYTDISGSWVLNQTKYPEYPINRGYDSLNKLNGTGMVGYWRFNNDSKFAESKTLAYDYSGMNHNATIVDFPYTYTGQKIGQAAIAPNDNWNDYVGITASRDFDTMPEVSISMWVNVNTCENNDEFLKYNGAYIIRIHSDCTVDLIFWNDDFRGELSTEALDTNKWYHLAFTYNSDDGGKLYINGNLDITNTAGSGDIDTANQNMGIGANADGSNEILSGEIDEVIIWNRTLTDSEVLKTMDITKSYIANFSVEGIADGEHKWNVLSYDNSSASAWASSNYTFTVGASGPVEDSCGCPSSGDWVVDCSDNCNNLTICDLGENNLILNGEGTFTIGADIYAGSLTKDKDCTLINKKNDGYSLFIKK